MRIHGIDIESRYEQSSELELMRAVIWDLPPKIREQINSVYVDSKATATFFITIKKWKNELATEIGSLFDRSLRQRLGGHNGIIITVNRQNAERTYCVPGAWDESCDVAGAYQILHKLRERWPMVFGEAVPLKIGIFADILKALKCNPRELKIALGFHCRSESYLRNLKRKAKRVDLNGHEVDEVTPGQAALAQHQLGNGD